MGLKYVKTERKEIIVFPESFGHDDFKSFRPVSAGSSVSITAPNKIRSSLHVMARANPLA